MNLNAQSVFGLPVNSVKVCWDELSTDFNRTATEF